MFVAGIILATLRVKDKQDFEYRMQQVQVMHSIAVQNEIQNSERMQSSSMSQFSRERANMLYGELKRYATANM